MAQYFVNVMFVESPFHADGGSPGSSYKGDHSIDPWVGFHPNNELSPGSSDDSNECGGWLPLVSPIPDDIFEPKEERVQVIPESNEPDDPFSARAASLEICPFCGFTALFRMTLVYEEICCLNDNCNKVCCHRCHAETHIPSTCKEAAKKRAREERRVAARELEEALSATMVHRCNRCKRSFDKTSGSNWMLCPVCDNKQCYVCRADAPFFSHFGDSSAGKCSLWGLRLATVRQVDEVKSLLAEMKEEREIAKNNTISPEIYQEILEGVQIGGSVMDQLLRTMEAAKDEQEHKAPRVQKIVERMDNIYPNPMVSNDEAPTGYEDELSMSPNIRDKTMQETQLHQPACQQKEDVMMIDVNLDLRHDQQGGTFPINDADSAVPLPGTELQLPAQESISSTWYIENWQQQQQEQQQNDEYHPITQEPQTIDNTQPSQEPPIAQLHQQPYVTRQPPAPPRSLYNEPLQRLQNIVNEKAQEVKEAKRITQQPETLQQTQVDHQLQAVPQSSANSDPQGFNGTPRHKSPIEDAHVEHSQPQPSLQLSTKSEATEDDHDTDLESSTGSSQTSEWELDEPILPLPRIDWEVDTPARPVMPPTPQLQPVEPVRYTDGFASDAYFRPDMDFGQGYDNIEWDFPDMMETEWYNAGLDGTSTRDASARDE